MHHRILAALALVCVIAMPSHAHPNYPGLRPIDSGKADRLEVRRTPQAKKRVIRRPVIIPAVYRTDKAQDRLPVRKVRADVLSVARRDLGTNPTGWSRLWCAVWLNRIENKVGRAGTGSALAKSFARYGKGVPLAKARPGDIVVTSRKGGGHVGILVAKNGETVRLISGNSGGRKGRRVVAEGNYPVSRIIAVRRVS